VDTDLIHNLNCFLNYLGEIVKLGRTVIRNVDNHKEFILYQHTLPKNNGISLFKPIKDQFLWLTVKQQIIKDPSPLPEVLENWVEVYNDPEIKPKIIESRHVSKETNNKEINNESETDLISFYIDERYDAYIAYEKNWELWAKETKEKKKTQDLFRQLFHAKEKLKYDEQLELVWGQGILLWKKENYTIKYPLINQRLLIEHDLEEAEISIFAPDDAAPELEFYSLKDLNIPDLSEVRDLFENTEYAPSDEDSFFKILKSIASSISPDSRIVNTFEEAQNLPLNIPKIVNCWVVFVRKRKENAVIRDIQNFKKQLENNQDKQVQFSEIMKVFLQEAEKKESINEFLSDTRDEWNAFLDKETLFPLPANHEQIQILDRIEHCNGIVVQGPPGTGKSHTIANLICHFMAQGKRVLVTSQKDRALGVLHGLIPDSLKSLCLSVLTFDSDNRKKLERAVNEVTKILTNANPDQLKKKIKELKDHIEREKGEIIEISNKIKDLANSQFLPIKVENEQTSKELLPSDLAQKLREENHKHAWLEDIPPYTVKRLRINNKDVMQLIINPPPEKEIEELKQLRKKLLPYLEELSYDIPSSEKLNNYKEFNLFAHNLKKYNALGNEIHNTFKGLIFKEENHNKIEMACNALRQCLEAHKKIQDPWQCSLLEKLKNNTLNVESIRQAKNKFLHWREEIKELAKIKIKDPLKNIQLGNSTDYQKLKEFVTDACERVKKGKNPCSLLDKKEKKRRLNNIRINDNPPKKEDWPFIKANVELLVQTNEIRRNWNLLASWVNAPEIEHTETLNDVDTLLIYIEKLSIPFDYNEHYFPIAIEILSHVMSKVEQIVTEDTLMPLYQALQLKKDQMAFWDSKKKLENLRNYLQKLKDTGKAQQVVIEMIDCIDSLNNDSSEKDCIRRWENALQKVNELELLKQDFDFFKNRLKTLSVSAPKWAKQWWMQKEESMLCPGYWRESWIHNALVDYLDDIYKETEKLSALKVEQEKHERTLRHKKEELSRVKTELGLTQNITENCVRSLKGWLLAVKKLGKGTGKWAWKKQKIVQKEMQQAQNAVPVWILPLYKVSETIPSHFCAFDIVIVDEASQCNELSFLALMRAKKVIVVGDPEQISPENSFIPGVDIERVKKEYLGNIPGNHRYDLSTSLYALADIAFSSHSALMLREHFRCIPQIIQFSNNLCYNKRILPLRNPPIDERLDPPLKAVFVPTGHREDRQNVNKPEAKAICEKIKELINDPAYADKTIGVISLTGYEQAKYIHILIDKYLSPEEQEKHKFRVGDSYAFQGDERNVIFLSMVVSGNDKKGLSALTADKYKQRFNVAASRAKDQMFLFHSAKLGVDLKKSDDLRYQLLYFFQNGYAPLHSGKNIKDLFESPLEEAVYEWLTNKGYRVTPQVKVGEYRIDLVVEGKKDRLAVECDGARWHPPGKWWEDSIRQRQLERTGWRFWRVWGSSFYKDPDSAMEPILSVLEEMNIKIERIEFANKKENEQKTEIHSHIQKQKKKITVDTTKHSGTQAEKTVKRLLSNLTNKEKKENTKKDIKKPKVIQKALFESDNLNKKTNNPPIEPSIVTDPLQNILSQILSAEELKCIYCGEKVKILIGRNGPFLKCTNKLCNKTKSVEIQWVQKAFEILNIPCQRCSKPMVCCLGPRGTFPGCSGYPECSTPERWMDLRERLKRLRKKPGKEGVEKS